MRKTKKQLEEEVEELENYLNERNKRIGELEDLVRLDQSNLYRLNSKVIALSKELDEEKKGRDRDVAEKGNWLTEARMEIRRLTQMYNNVVAKLCIIDSVMHQDIQFTGQLKDVGGIPREKE